MIQYAWWFIPCVTNYRSSSGIAICCLEQTERGTDYARKLTMIREAAEAAAKEITEHQRRLDAEAQSTERKAS